MPQRQLHIAIGLLLFPALVIGAPPGALIDGAEFLVNTGSTSAAASDVAAAADGTFVIAWQSTPDTPAAFPQIAAKRYTASAVALGDEFRVDSSATAAFAPAIAVDASGQFAVAWWHFDGFEIRGRRHAADGSPVGSEFIATNPPFVGLTQTGNPAVAAIFLGQFVVLWEGTGDFLRYDIVGRRIDDNGVPIGNGFTVNTSFADDHAFAAVAADGAGNYIACWNAGATLLARKFTSAGVFGPPFEVAVGTGPGSAIAADGSGKFIVVWRQDEIVMARRFGADTLPIGPAFRIDQSGAASAPDVAMFADGGFVVAWQKSMDELKDADVLARRFDAAGQPTGDELPVNVTTAGVQSQPALATGIDGAFVVAWTSQAPLANDTDVHARRMGAIDAIFADGFE